MIDQKIILSYYKFSQLWFATKKFRQINTEWGIVEVEENEIPGSWLTKQIKFSRK